MIKRIISLALSVCIMLTLCACNDNEDTDNTTNTTEQYVLPTEIIDADISLPYTDAESFDPYISKSTLNRALIPVLYESLYTSASDGKGRPSLAKGSKIDGAKVTIQLRENIKFSDGTELTAVNVKDSYERAINCSYYSGSLSGIKSISVADNHTVIFNFSDNSLFTLNTLVFPIVKNDGNKCIGTGKYKLQYLDEIPYLSVNTKHREFNNSWNKQIALYNMAGISTPVYPFKANEISVYKNDLSDKEYLNLSSKTISEDLNNLVYIGVNSNWAGSLTSIDWVRHAINIGIDRSMISASSYLGQTSPVITPYKTEMYALDTENLPDISGELQRAVAILERNGYNSINENGVRTNGVNTLSVSILVCTKNQYKLTVAETVKKALEDIGFGVTINEKKTVKAFKKALNEGHFDMYIGETNLSYDYGLEEFFSDGGNLNYGIDKEFYKEYELMKSGETSFMTFIESFETEVPFIPLFYRKAVISLNPNISGADEKSVYSSVSDWKIKK